MGKGKNGVCNWVGKTLTKKKADLFYPKSYKVEKSAKAVPGGSPSAFNPAKRKKKV